jgi:hypothetical protein
MDDEMGNIVFAYVNNRDEFIVYVGWGKIEAD